MLAGSTAAITRQAYSNASLAASLHHDDLSNRVDPPSLTHLSLRPLSRVLPPSRYRPTLLSAAVGISAAYHCHAALDVCMAVRARARRAAYYDSTAALAVNPE